MTSRARKPWTPDEDAVIVRDYHYGSAEAVARRLGRSVHAVKHRARKLGVNGYRNWIQRGEIRYHGGKPMIKVAENLWRDAHLVVWESRFGPIPSGYVLVLLDGDPNNLNTDNMVVVPRGAVGIMNRLGLNDVPPELRPTAIALARLIYAAGQAARRVGDPSWSPRKLRRESGGWLTGADQAAGRQLRRVVSARLMSCTTGLSRGTKGWWWDLTLECGHHEERRVFRVNPSDPPAHPVRVQCYQCSSKRRAPWTVPVRKREPTKG